MLSDLKCDSEWMHVSAWVCWCINLHYFSTHSPQSTRYTCWKHVMVAEIRRRACLVHSYNTTELFHGPIAYALSLFVWSTVRAHTCPLARKLSVPLQWEREGTSPQSRPQAAPSIGLVKVQGYRWVTKPPLITNHFCHESRLEWRAAKSLYQTKKSDRACTFLISGVFGLAGLLASLFLSGFLILSLLFFFLN